MLPASRYVFICVDYMFNLPVIDGRRLVQTSSTRQILIEVMKSLGYHTIELLLTPLQFGIPNSRLRYYMLARKTPFSIPLPPYFRPSEPTANEYAPPLEDRVWRHIPGRGSDWVDPRNGLNVESVDNNVDEIRRYLDRGKESGWNKVAGEDGKDRWMHPHMIPDRVLEKWGRLFDIVLPEARRTCCFTRGECSVLLLSCYCRYFSCGPHGG